MLETYWFAIIAVVVLYLLYVRFVVKPMNRHMSTQKSKDYAVNSDTKGSKSQYLQS